MGLTVSQTLGILDSAIADAEANRTSRLRWRRERAIAVHFTAPVMLGERGFRAGFDDADRPMFGYTLAQCRRMRETIYAAARADLEAMESSDG